MSEDGTKGWEGASGKDLATDETQIKHRCGKRRKV
jgi:hypothetical protein